MNALNYVTVAIAVLWPFVAFWLLTSFTPKVFTRFVEKEIDRRSDAKLSQFRADLESRYSTLKNSIDLLSQSNSGMRPHTVEAVSKLWRSMLEMRKEFAGVFVFDAIILTTEAVDAFQNEKNPQNARILDMIRNHIGDIHSPVRQEKYFADDLEFNRLFCGDKLWLIFYVYRAVCMRSSLLISWSFERGKFQDWKQDGPISQLLRSALDGPFVDEVINAKLNGLNTALSKLEANFLHEASRVMSGSKALSDSLSDVQSLLLLESAKLATEK